MINIADRKKAVKRTMEEASELYTSNLRFLMWDSCGLDVEEDESGGICLRMADGTLQVFDPWRSPEDLSYAMVLSGACPTLAGRKLVIGGETYGDFTDEEIMDKDFMFSYIKCSFHMYAQEKALRDNPYMRDAGGLLFEEPS